MTTKVPNAIAERFKEMTALWHLWRACVLEELGEVPAGLEQAVETAILECLQEAKAKLEEASQACEEAISSLGLAQARQ